jgi:hypothetical protein
MAKRNTQNKTTTQRGVWPIVGWFTMALVFGVTGWFFAMEPLSVAFGNWLQARDYQATSASVAQRTGKDADGSFDWYVAQYRVGEKTFETTRLTVLDDENIDEPSNEAVLKNLEKAFREKQQVTVWVSPRKSDVAIVSRELPLRSLGSRLPMALGFAIFSLAGATGSLGAIANFAYYRRMADAAGLWLFSALWCGFTFPMFLVAAQSSDSAWVPVVFVGVFALIGALMLYGAVITSIRGVRETNADANAASTPKAAVRGHTKRSGFGGRGDDFDKD